MNPYRPVTEIFPLVKLLEIIYLVNKTVLNKLLHSCHKCLKPQGRNDDTDKLSGMKLNACSTRMTDFIERQLICLGKKSLLINNH